LNGLGYGYTDSLTLTSFTLSTKPERLYYYYRMITSRQYINSVILVRVFVVIDA